MLMSEQKNRKTLKRGKRRKLFKREEWESLTAIEKLTLMRTECCLSNLTFRLLIRYFYLNNKVENNSI
jgi:hypothetical protein